MSKDVVRLNNHHIQVHACSSAASRVLLSAVAMLQDDSIIARVVLSHGGDPITLMMMRYVCLDAGFRGYVFLNA